MDERIKKGRRMLRNDCMNVLNVEANARLKEALRTGYQL